MGHERASLLADVEKSGVGGDPLVERALRRAGEIERDAKRCEKSRQALHAASLLREEEREVLPRLRLRHIHLDALVWRTVDRVLRQCALQSGFAPPMTDVAHRLRFEHCRLPII